MPDSLWRAPSSADQQTSCLRSPVGAYMLHKRHGQLIGFFAATLPPALLFMTYNICYFGFPLTTGFAALAVAPSSFWQSSSYLLRTPLSEGLLGILVSPGRGLLIYSPILACSFVGMATVWMKSGHILLKYLSLAVFFFIILTAKWGMWWGGHSYGPRLLADITPILCLYLYPPFTWSETKVFFKSAFIAAFIGLSALSMGFHALGVFADGSWNFNPNNVDEHPERLWSWADAPPIYYGAKMLAEAHERFIQMKRIVPALTN